MDSDHHQTTTTTLVFIPFPEMSHQAPMIQMANLLVARDPRLSATILVMKMPAIFTSPAPDNNNNNNNNNPRIKIVELPPDDLSLAEWDNSPHTFVARFAPSQKGSVRAAVAKITDRIAGFVVDLLCTSMMDLARDLRLPSYGFFPCGAATLGLFFHLQALRDGDPARDLAAEFGSEAVPTYAVPVPAKVWPSMVFGTTATTFTDSVRKFREAQGIVVNTFLELEPHAVRALSADKSLPTVYPVGPIIQGASPRDDGSMIVEWLDGRADSSVVFVCFGSNGSFERDQVEEIAVALEKWGGGFLWSLRKPPPKDKLEFPGEYENPGEALPEGFLERTEGVGKVIGWAPQMAVLAHRAVGGFVSHCGWNSILESVWCDVPLAAWPLAAEQQANAFQLVKEIGVAVEIKMDYRKGCEEIVEAKVIEKAIRELMMMGQQGINTAEGRRAKVRELSDKSRGVMAEGGSSYDFLGRFIDNVLDSVATPPPPPAAAHDLIIN